MQTLDFKQSPLEVQELFIGHVAATEKLMFEQAAENPMFGERLGQLRQFPMFYTPSLSMNPYLSLWGIEENGSVRQLTTDASRRCQHRTLRRNVYRLGRLSRFHRQSARITYRTQI